MSWRCVVVVTFLSSVAVLNPDSLRYGNHGVFIGIRVTYVCCMRRRPLGQVVGFAKSDN